MPAKTILLDEESEMTRQALSKPKPKIEMIKLPLGLSMGKYEVTQGQWQAVMGSNPSKFTSFGENRPVEQVSFDDVQRFIERLNSLSGKHYRLPTEVEWYKACQAGGSYTEYCGSGNIDDVAWYKNNSNQTTHEVGQKNPNAFNLYDMSGNVWEWTSSCLRDECSRLVGRGGSWANSPTTVRMGGLFWYYTTKSETLGFRLALDD
jgi:formylglycine-generating enzyme required for sulfatase activity